MDPRPLTLTTEVKNVLFQGKEMPTCVLRRARVAILDATGPKEEAVARGYETRHLKALRQKNIMPLLVVTGETWKGSVGHKVHQWPEGRLYCSERELDTFPVVGWMQHHNRYFVTAELREIVRTESGPQAVHRRIRDGREEAKVTVLET
jgi:hypothetical protein